MSRLFTTSAESTCDDLASTLCCLGLIGEYLEDHFRDATSIKEQVEYAHMVCIRDPLIKLELCNDLPLWI